jgi:serine/threonine protein kinase/tetratricopeptide (TPR) repeat protein
MGEVYLAHDPRLERSVALKVLPEELAADTQRMHRFIREAKTTSSLNHPNLLTIYEIGQDGPIHFIATEFVDGITLRDRMRSPLELKDSLRIVIQIAEALAAAHEAGVVHRDIKPENIMLRRRDQIVKVLDFGLAKLTEEFIERQDADPDASTRMIYRTEPSVILGTMRYMSPEQARGLPVDARTDIWSLGVVLYELIAHQAPFTGPTTSDLLVSILDREPALLTDSAPETPPELQRIIRKTLAKDRDKRYQSIKDLAVDLESLRWELEVNHERQRSGAGIPRPQPLNSNPALPTTETLAPTTAPLEGQIYQSQQLSSAGHIVAGIKQVNKGVLAGLAALLILVLSGVYFYFSRSTERSIDSIAVLPFANVDGDPNMEYLSDGITESLTDSISQLPNLSVIAHSSVFRYKGRESDPQTVGHQLGVRALLIGRIVQRGDRLIVSAELVDVENNHRIWGGQYDRRPSDIIAVQSEISREISEQLRSRLTNEEQKRVAKHYTENTEAYQDYLKGRYYWNKRSGDDLKRAIDYFNQAITKDPAYALAYAGLADVYVVIPNYSDVTTQEAYAKGKAAVLKALELDDSLAEAHTSFAGIKSDYEWDYVGAETELKRALTLNPNYATAHHWYAQLLSPMGRHDEALAEIKRAQSLDPLSLIISAVIGDTYIKARQYDLALDQLRKTIEMDKNFNLAYRYLANAYVEKGMYNEAIASLRTGDTLAGRSPERTESLRQAYASGGVEGYWKKQLELLKADAEKGALVDYGVATVYARLGDKEQAVSWLEKAYRAHDPYLVYLKIDPPFDNFRSDPRVIDMTRRMGLAP